MRVLHWWPGRRPAVGSGGAWTRGAALLMRPAAPDGAHVLAFCDGIVASGSVLRVASRPLPGRPLNECFNIVPENVAARGGEAETGWAIWERPGVFIEAEFHVVWRDPAGERVDIAPHAIACDAITFLPDPRRRYEGRVVDNVRKALVRDRDVVRFLFLAARRVEIVNRQQLAARADDSAAAKRRMTEYVAILRELGQLERRLARRYRDGG